MEKPALYCHLSGYQLKDFGGEGLVVLKVMIKYQVRDGSHEITSNLLILIASDSFISWIFASQGYTLTLWKPPLPCFGLLDVSKTLKERGCFHS